jgi:hypothetical protein
MKTAVTMLGEAFRQWQKDWDSYDKGICDKPKSYDKFISPFIELEKEQIEIAFDLGRDEVTSEFIIDGEDYYNKKFNQNK